MKDSMKRFYEYTGPDGVLKDYYPKKFVRYIFEDYPNAVYGLNQCKAFHGEGTLSGYESSLRMAEQLEELYKKYCDSLWLTSPFPMSK